MVLWCFHLVVVARIRNFNNKKNQRIIWKRWINHGHVNLTINNTIRCSYNHWNNDTVYISIEVWRVQILLSLVLFAWATKRMRSRDVWNCAQTQEKLLNTHMNLPYRHTHRHTQRETHRERDKQARQCAQRSSNGVQKFTVRFSMSW